ncbi:hypothetical protein ACSSS7_007595 [Eimeria intestinalis]
MAAVHSSDPGISRAIAEPLLPPDARASQSTQGFVDEPLYINSLFPVSPCPPLAFDTRVQSVDLFATGAHILEGAGRCAWCPCCTGARGPPFDWISFLHTAATTLASLTPNEVANSPIITSGSDVHDSQFSEQQHRSAPRETLSDSEQALAVIQSLRDGAVPVGANPDLPTLVKHNQLVFGGVKEVNAAYSNAWLCIYICMVFALLLAPLGWVLLLLVSVSSTVRRTLDEYVLYWMSKACSRVNLLLYPCGVALMLLEGSAQDSGLTPAAAAALVDVELAQAAFRSRAQPGAKVWVLRVFMLPAAGASRGTHHLADSR